MDTFTQNVFLDEIELQCTFALQAWDGVQRAVAARDAIYNNILYYHLQALLISSANVSKILFPAPRSKKDNPDFVNQCMQRADDLRTLLGVPKDSILSNRKLRNHFEHLDERLQEWASTPGPKILFKNTILGGITPQQLVSAPHLTPKSFVKTYSIQPPAVYFWGEEYELEPLITAIRSVFDGVQQLKPKPPFPPPF